MKAAFAKKFGTSFFMPLVADPYFSDVRALVRANGTHGGTAFQDLGPLGLSVATVGDASIDTGNVKFNSGSIKLAGAGNLGLTSSTAFSFGSGDITMEGWCFKLSNSGSQTLASITQGSAAGRGLIFYPNAPKLSLVNESGSAICSDPDDFPTNAWTHWAWSRKSGVSYIAVNGVVKASASDSATIGSSTSNFLLGIWLDNSNFRFSGNLEDVRLTAAGRFDDDFALPTEAYQTY